MGVTTSNQIGQLLGSLGGAPASRELTSSCGDSERSSSSSGASEEEEEVEEEEQQAKQRSWEGKSRLTSLASWPPCSSRVGPVRPARVSICCARRRTRPDRCSSCSASCGELQECGTRSKSCRGSWQEVQDFGREAPACCEGQESGKRLEGPGGELSLSLDSQA